MPGRSSGPSRCRAPPSCCRDESAPPAGRAPATSAWLPARLPTGPRNAITDVPGIRVGHATVIEGERRSAPASRPSSTTTLFGAARSGPCCGLAVFNGFGKMVGSHPAHRARHDRDAGAADEHAVGLPGRRRAALATCMTRPGLRRGRVAEPGRRRDQRRLPVRHLGPTHHRRSTCAPRLTARPAARWPRAASGPAPAPARSGTRPGSARLPGLRHDHRPGHARRARAGQLRRRADRARHAVPAAGTVPSPGSATGNSCVIVLATDARPRQPRS